MSNSSNAGVVQHADPRDPMMGAGHDLNGSLQRQLPVGVDVPRFMAGPSVPGTAKGARTDQRDRQRSVEHRMAGMRMAFISSGGLRSVGELTRGTDLPSQSRFAQIAHWIATREIIGFMWHSEPWVPMFQFNAGPHLQPRLDLQPLFGLLAPLYDAWEMANWFAKPNYWLSGHRPVDDCAENLSAVLDVAHLEHFIASGKIEPQAPASSPINAGNIAA